MTSNPRTNSSSPAAVSVELASLRRDPRDLGWRPEHPQATWLLAEMLRWARGWRLHHTRSRMQRAGFLFPPVLPRNSHPLQDWYLFERWVAGQPVRWSYTETYGEPLPPEILDGIALVRELNRVLARLAQHGVHVAVPGAAPRPFYIWLCDYLRRERFPFLCDETDLLVAASESARAARVPFEVHEEFWPSPTALAYASR